MDSNQDQLKKLMIKKKLLKDNTLEVTKPELQTKKNHNSLHFQMEKMLHLKN